jgi:hypothetical protein
MKERNAHRDILQSARALGHSGEAPLNDWSSLQAALWSRGMITAAPPAEVVAARLTRRFALVAAGLALLVGGIAAGRVSAGAAWLPAPGRGAVVSTLEPAPFTSTAQALDVYLKSQVEFQRSAAYLAVNGEAVQGSPETVLTRLAALEEIFSASAAGLRGAPADPVLNDYYVSSLSAREATRRQLDLFTQVGLRRVSY